MGPRDEMMNFIQELQSPFTEQNFKVSCETNKDFGSEDVRQCAVEYEPQGKTVKLYSSFLEVGDMSEETCCGHEEAHVFSSIDRLGYKNKVAGAGLSSSNIFLRRFQLDYPHDTIGDRHDWQ